MAGSDPEVLHGRPFLASAARSTSSPGSSSSTSTKRKALIGSIRLARPVQGPEGLAHAVALRRCAGGRAACSARWSQSDCAKAISSSAAARATAMSGAPQRATSCSASRSTAAARSSALAGGDDDERRPAEALDAEEAGAERLPLLAREPRHVGAEEPEACRSPPIRRAPPRARRRRCPTGRGGSSAAASEPWRARRRVEPGRRGERPGQAPPLAGRQDHPPGDQQVAVVGEPEPLVAVPGQAAEPAPARPARSRRRSIRAARTSGGGRSSRRSRPRRPPRSRARPARR